MDAYCARLYCGCDWNELPSVFWCYPAFLITRATALPPVAVQKNFNGCVQAARGVLRPWTSSGESV